MCSSSISQKKNGEKKNSFKCVAIQYAYIHMRCMDPME